ncbi:hypothetical protein JTB14_009718 [Gonioctena quinquepunctata]|nr:hypothetical protein JTB14_009718 [Gonioctena quinquepunctata]
MFTNIHKIAIIACFLFVSYIPSIDGKHLASFVKPCRKDDPNLKACFLKRSKEVMAHLIKGNAELKTPSFSPFYVAAVEVEPLPGFLFRMENLTVYGLDGTEFVDIDWDSYNIIRLRFVAEKTESRAHYRASGKLLAFPINAEGSAFFQTENSTTESIIRFESFQKGGKKYVNTSTIEVDFKNDPGKVHFGIDNLFNGNKLLNDNFNKFMNENPDELQDMINVPVTEIMRAINKNLFEILRVTPIEGIGLSPAQLIMNRSLKTKIPVSDNLLKPNRVSLDDAQILKKPAVAKHDKVCRERKELNVGQNITIKKTINGSLA